MDEFLILLRETLSERGYCFVIGFIGGVLACWRFCPAYWTWRIHRFNVAREDRLRKEQECKDAEQRRLVSCREQEEKKRIFEGIFFDEYGNPCCPCCHVPLHECRKSGIDGSFFGTCSKCGKKIYSNAGYETIRQHIQSFRHSSQ